jgi:hypothetical protein
VLIIGIHADDYLIITKEGIFSSLIDELKYHEFNLKIERNVDILDLLHWRVKRRKKTYHDTAAYVRSFYSKFPGWNQRKKEVPDSGNTKI